MSVRVLHLDGRLVWLEEPPRPYGIEITCARCGADTRYVTGGSRWHWQQAAVVECTECAWAGLVSFDISEAFEDPRSEGRRVRRERNCIERERVSA